MVGKADASSFVVEQMEEVKTMLVKNRGYIEIISQLLEAKENVSGTDIYNAIHKRYGSGYALTRIGPTEQAKVNYSFSRSLRWT